MHLNGHIMQEMSFHFNKRMSCVFRYAVHQQIHCVKCASQQYLEIHTWCFKSGSFFLGGHVHSYQDPYMTHIWLIVVIWEIAFISRNGPGPGLSCTTERPLIIMQVSGEESSGGK